MSYMQAVIVSMVWLAAFTLAGLFIWSYIKRIGRAAFTHLHTRMDRHASHRTHQ
jgi:hypothetical protein